ncbi:MAG: GH3 auxin-responsive promoter family protein [Candidatus Lokiarchaeota archaeon]|nr:GH3 auxin-responsive promoter family protein [Candidatus Lokiarchaeota archaeon]
MNIAGKKMLKQLNDASKDCRGQQKRVLLDIVNYAKDTEFGRLFNFSSIKNIEDFQKLVPINKYEDLKSFILQHANGEENVLFPGKPFIYATTSGTTSEPKWIPITEKYFKECYNGLSKLWFYSLLKENPRIFDGPELSIVGKAIEGHIEDGTPYGSFSGHVYENIPKFLKKVHVIPEQVYRISDYFARYYCLMRFTIEHSIKLIVTGNPSTILELHNVTIDNYDSLIRDIQYGTLKEDLLIEKKLRNVIIKDLKPNPERAEFLRELKEQYNTVYPKHYWPELEVVNTWKCGNSGLYLKHTKEFFPNSVKIREFGYLATEARAGIVLDSFNDASILAAHLLFFEFIKKEDIELQNPQIYLAHELEAGQIYYLIVTTSSGLYRYNMEDIIQVEGFYNEFPMFKFIQKGGGITSLTGEKLHEQQLLEAINEVEHEFNIYTRFHIGFADLDSSAYHLFVEFPCKMSEKTIEAYGHEIDNKLRQLNIEYESKRGSNRIKPLVIHSLERNAFEKFKAICMDRGYRDGQFKLTHLMIDHERMKIFESLSIRNQTSTIEKFN